MPAAIRRLLITAPATGIAGSDYRIDGPGRYKTKTLGTHEFIRRFMIHVMPPGFHLIRHYGLFASSAKADNLALARTRRRAAEARGCHGSGHARSALPVLRLDHAHYRN